MKLIWIPLPNGYTGRTCHASIFLSPHLMIPGGRDGDEDTLGNQDGFKPMLNWPEFLHNRLRNKIKLELNGEDVELNWQFRMDFREMKSFWRAIFSENTRVRHRVIKHPVPKDHLNVIHTYPVATVVRDIERVYKTLIEDVDSARNHPSQRVLRELLEPLRYADVYVPGQLPNYSTSFPEGSGVDSRALRVKDAGYVTFLLRPRDETPERLVAMSKEEFAYWSVNRFYRRPEPSTTREVSNPSLDFHQLLSHLADFPELLRRLGLIMDVTFSPPGNAPAEGTLRVKIDAGPPGPDRLRHICPYVRYRINSNRFEVPPRNSARFQEGFLKLSSSEFCVYQMDADGAALKLIDTARNLNRDIQPPKQTFHTPGTGVVPSLRNGGVTIAAQDRAAELIKSLDASFAINSHLEDSRNKGLMLEDVLRGFRIDVKDVERDVWRSLQQRIVTHFFSRGQEVGLPEELRRMQFMDEAIIRAQAATAARPEVPVGEPGDQLYLHEALFGWDGWSLAASRPGKLIAEPGQGDSNEDEHGEEETPDHRGPSSLAVDRLEHDPSVPIETETKVQPETLARQRVGRTYRLRARVVDLAGNSQPLDAQEPSEAPTSNITYLRYEPIASPVIVRCHPDTAGESLEVMVVRSNPNSDGATSEGYPEYARETFGSQFDFRTDSQRHLAPPKTSVQMAELAGKFDDAVDDIRTRQALYMMACQEERTFFDAHVLDLSNYEEIEGLAPHIHVQAGQTNIAAEKLTRGYVPPNAGQLYRTDESLPLPYLPDPFAGGVAIHGDPGNEVHATFTFSSPHGEWWDKRPFRLRLTGTTAADLTISFGPPNEDNQPVDLEDNQPVDLEETDSVTIAIPPAMQVRLRVSSLPAVDLADPTVHPAGTRVNVVKKMALFALASNPNALEADAEEGRIWLLTPFRYITLIHATQRPLSAPSFYDPPVLDDAVKPRPTISATHRDFDSDGPSSHLVRGIGDTFASFSGKILLDGKSTGRIDVWAEWADPIDTGDPSDPPRFGNNANLPAKKAFAFGWEVSRDELSEAPLNLVNKENGSQRVSRHEIGDTKYHHIEYTPVATTRFREFFPPEITDVPENIQVEGKPIKLHILNSAPPKAPQVLYIVPIFKWERSDDGLTSTRRGGGLRVYLNRPWFSSGDGERLGVVLPDPNLEWESIPTDFTNWGRDPVWSHVSRPNKKLEVEHFPSRNKFESEIPGISQPESAGRPSQPVRVASHEVRYAADRGLWYCDVVIENEGTYFPFVRLALARFQPQSIPGAHLSSVIVADFIQLVADRSASLVFDDQNRAHVAVSGVAPYNYAAFDRDAERDGKAPFDNLNISKSRRVTLTLQRQDEETASDLGWHNVGEEEDLAVSERDNDRLVWRTSLKLPEGYRDGLRHRLLVREYERFVCDKEKVKTIYPPRSREEREAERLERLAGGDLDFIADRGRLGRDELRALREAVREGRLPYGRPRFRQTLSRIVYADSFEL